eukprot:2921242-Rhodomonas_salina.3
MQSIEMEDGDDSVSPPAMLTGASTNVIADDDSNVRVPSDPTVRAQSPTAMSDAVEKVTWADP